MTAPALLISLIAQTIQSWHAQGGLDVIDILLRYGFWFLSVLLLFMAVRLLRGTHRYTTTLRVAGFAQSAHVLEMIAFIPVIGGTARFRAVILSVIGVWMGVATANELKGWRTIILPLIYVIIIVVAFVFLVSAISGVSYTLNTLMQSLGLVIP